MRRWLCWRGWQGSKLGEGTRGGSIEAWLDVGLSCGGWMAMSGTCVVGHDDGLVDWHDFFSRCVCWGSKRCLRLGEVV